MRYVVIDGMKLPLCTVPGCDELGGWSPFEDGPFIWCFDCAERVGEEGYQGALL